MFRLKYRCSVNSNCLHRDICFRAVAKARVADRW